LERKYFGTDGIRGIVPDELSPEFAIRVGRAAQIVLAQKNSSCVIGGDTRISTGLIKSALASGIAVAGGNVFDAGVIPTPGVSFLVNHFEFAYGGVISASHNPFEYNGIKFFDDQGFKLSDDVEAKIEELIDSSTIPAVDPGSVGRIFEIEDGNAIYSDYLTSFLKQIPDMRIVFDCANGATSIAARMMAEKAGLNAEFINTEPDGRNINLNCGATHPDTLARFVVENGYDGGFAFDGDGDRVIAVDSKGNQINGDQLLGFLATYYREKGLLKQPVVVGTVMSNYGLEQKLSEQGFKLVRAKVGDRYVLEEMQAKDAVIGGEDSGHIILLDKSRTGDGLLVAAVILNALAENKLTFTDLINFKPVTRVLINVRVKDKNSFSEDEIIKQAISKAEAELVGKGRIVVRPSGTEPLIRVMVEAEDSEFAASSAKKIAALIEERLGG
jgi:phosphoglucosamine mutase